MKQPTYNKAAKLTAERHQQAKLAAIRANITLCAWLDIACKNQAKKGSK